MALGDYDIIDYIPGGNIVRDTANAVLATPDPLRTSLIFLPGVGAGYALDQWSQGKTFGDAVGSAGQFAGNAIGAAIPAWALIAGVGLMAFVLLKK